MAQKKTFLEQPVDRTPYAACVWVVLAVLALFFLAGLGLWKVSGMVKKSLPKANIAPVDTNLLDQAKEAAKGKADAEAAEIQQRLQAEFEQQKDAALEQAEEAAKKEAEKQLNNQVEQQKNQLQQFLP